MAEANVGWGAPRIHGELLKLGLEVSERTVSRLMPKRSTAPSQTWRAFLDNHVRDFVSIDFFTVPTARLRVLFVFIVLSHERRRVIQFNITEHPTTAWTAQQIIEAFPEDQTPRYLVRDRDGIYGEYFQHRVQGMGIPEVRTAPRSPWQNPYVERVIGSIRRECLNQVIVLHDKYLRRILKSYFRYYLDSRTIYPWRRIRRTRDRSKHWKQDVSSKSLKSAACTIVTSVVPPESEGERQSTIQKR